MLTDSRFSKHGADTALSCGFAGVLSFAIRLYRPVSFSLATPETLIPLLLTAMLYVRFTTGEVVQEK